MWQKMIKSSLITQITLLLLVINAYNAFECGVRKMIINQVIVRGQSTSPGDWPWHVAIYRDREYVCSGTLISEVFVLTANHCVRDENEYVLSSRKIFVQLGVHNLHKVNPKIVQQHDVLRIHKYRSTEMLRNDIAIVELNTKAEFTNYVQPACLNQVEDLTRQFGTAIGWGKDDTNEVSPILKSQQMPVVSTNRCLDLNEGVFRNILDSSIFCAGYTNGTTVYNGDSGGGLHFERNGVWYVGGITSFTAPRQAGRNTSNLESYAGFTDVHHFLPWIRNVTGLGRINENAGRKENTNQKSGHYLLPQDCGKYLVNRIFSGTRAELYEFPWIVKLFNKNEKITGCHGSLINKRYVLTNARCLTDANFEPLFIVLGKYDWSREKDCSVNDPSDCSPPAQSVGIESVIVHSKYNSTSFKNDIGLIRLARDIKFENHIQPICLPHTPLLKQQRIKQGIIAGWGARNFGGDVPQILQKATVKIIENSECKNKIFRWAYTGKHVICSGGNATPNTCLWDFGAPLGYPFLYNKQVRFVQYGISADSGCENVPSIYTFVPDYMDWILANLKP